MSQSHTSNKSVFVSGHSFTMIDHKIKIFEDVLSSVVCQDLIDVYDSTSDVVVRDTDGYRFNEINIIDSPSFDKHRANVTKAMTDVHSFYASHYPSFPHTQNYEAPRIKKYDQGIGEFDWHIDATTVDTCKRILVMFFYLNDVEVGGETLFDLGENQLGVQPKTGSVVCFPPHWTHPHKGCIPISGDKYVISSYVQI